MVMGGGMAYFKWYGVDMAGHDREGKMFARSEQELDELLLRQEVALISCGPVRQSFLKHSVKLEDKIHFFRQLAALLDAGVMLPDALDILCELLTDIQLRSVIHSVSADVHGGIPLSDALTEHTQIFDDLMIRMIRVGQETGKLGAALEHLAAYLDTMNGFAKRLRTAAMLPLITFSFFVLITSIIFLVIVPRFTQIFRSMNKDVPTLTKLVVNVSDALRSGYAILIGSLCILVVLGIVRYMKSVRGKPIFDAIILRIPWIGSLTKKSAMTCFLHSVSMLLGNGVLLVKALRIAGSEVKNGVVRQQIAELEQAVTAGVALSRAMSTISNTVFEADVIAIARVGEESGNLGLMLKKAAVIYEGKVNRSITFFTTIFQPLLMIVLGLLITLLIFAVYVPVFNLASVV
jgi:type IV pilus assembly protein PilC